MIKLSRNILSIALCCFTNFTANAQLQIIQKTIAKLTASKNVSYTVIETSSFAGSDTRAEIKAAFNNRQSDGNSSSYLVNVNASYGKFKYMNDGIRQIDLELDKNIYIIKPEKANRSYPDLLFDAVNKIKTIIADDKHEMHLLKDSVINKKPSYHISINVGDMTSKSYEIMHVFINKKDNMVLAFSDYSQGEATKEGMSLGTIKLSQDLWFTTYQLNIVKPKAIVSTIPAGFQPEQKALPLLTNGTVAPPWDLSSTDDQKLSLASLKGKVVLIDFGFNACPACILALPSIEKLHKKYDGTDVAIVSINTLDSKAEVAKFKAANNIRTSIYVNGGPISKAYHVQGGPIFFIIDKQGKINQSYNGYFENFDSEVAAKIEALR